MVNIQTFFHLFFKTYVQYSTVHTELTWESIICSGFINKEFSYHSPSEEVRSYLYFFLICCIELLILPTLSEVLARFWVGDLDQCSEEKGDREICNLEGVLQTIIFLAQ